MRRTPSLAMAAAVAMTVSFSPRPVLAAIDAAASFEQLSQAWMGAVALLAHDGDGGEDGERGHGGHDRHRGGEHAHGDHGPADRPRDGRGPGGPGPRGMAEGPRAALAKMDEILARLSRIEAKLDGRAGGPPRFEGRGPRPEMPEQARRMMEERMRGAREGMSEEDRARFDERMKAARARMREGGARPEGRPEVPAEVREQMRKRMEEGRERMDQARQAFRQMEERIRKLEAEIERLKADR